MPRTPPPRYYTEHFDNHTKFVCVDDTWCPNGDTYTLAEFYHMCDSVFGERPDLHYTDGGHEDALFGGIVLRETTDTNNG